MNVLSTAAVLLILNAGAGTPPARPIDLIYSEGKYPSGDASYVPCDGRPVDYCVPEGVWVGLCSTKTAPEALARFEGPLLFKDGVPRIQGCEENVRLMWKRQGTAAPAYQAPKASPLKMAQDVTSVDFTQAGHTYSVALNKKALRLEVKVDSGPKRVVDLRKEFGEAVKLSSLERLDSVGDLSGDGAPEVIVSLSREGYTREFERRRRIPVAVMVTLSEPLRVVGFTSGSPVKLYGPGHCAAVGCDVVGFLDKKESCHHFGGEEPYDEERRKEILEAMQGCDALESRRKALLKKYRGNPSVQKVLTVPAGTTSGG
ncbi:hypothetical protein ACLESD_12870 [Pyxidicoccus sp. 3LFB2]